MEGLQSIVWRAFLLQGDACLMNRLGGTGHNPLLMSIHLLDYWRLTTATHQLVNAANHTLCQEGLESGYGITPAALALPIHPPEDLDLVGYYLLHECFWGPAMKNPSLQKHRMEIDR